MAEDYGLIQYVDREQEIRQILSEIKQTSTSLVKMIYAGTAIGKSSLVSKLFMSQQMEPFIKIVVHTPPENTNPNTNESLFLNYIFNSFFEYFDKPHITTSAELQKLSFESYILNNKDKIVQREILDAVVNSLQKTTNKFHLISCVIFFSIKRLWKIGEFNVYNLLNEDTLLTRRLKSRYIEFVLSSARVALDVDNFQNIDYASLQNVINWLNNHKKNRHLFIFEYTTSENDNDTKLLSLASQLEQSGMKAHLQPISKMPENYVVDIISKKLPNLPTNFSFNVDLLNYYNSDASGNLRKLIDFSLKYNKTSLTQHYNPTVLNLIDLSDSAKYIIGVLSLNNGIISRDFLESLLFMRPDISKEISSCIYELEQNMLIENHTNTICISHASILDAWNSSPASHSYNALAYTDIERLLLKSLNAHTLENMHCDNETWLKLLHVYSTFEPQKIDSLFDKLEKGLIDYISPDNAWKYLKAFIDSTKSNIIAYRELYIRIVNICFESELYQEGFECLTLLTDAGIASADAYLLELYAMFLSALDKHEENIQFCTYQLNKLSGITDQAYLNFSMILLTSYRSLNKIDKCKAVFSELINATKYRKYKEYGYLLRTTDMYLPKRQSAVYVYKSYRFFMKTDKIQAGKSLITLSYLLANLGHTYWAHRAILKAEKLLKGKRMGAHMFLVNKAAICLMRGKHDVNVYEMLDQAEISAKVSFDKLAIYINKLIWCYENKNFEKKDLIINSIMQYLCIEPDKHIVAIAHYNLSVFYKLMNNMEAADSHYNLAYNLKENCIPLKNRLNKINSKDTNVMCSKPWHVCFLAYWTYDIFRDDEVILPNID